MARRRKATTAYELCERTCEAIAAHPLAYFQKDWIRTGARRPEELRGDTECETTFCRAGWLVAVHDGKSRATDAGEISTRADVLLGRRRDLGDFDFAVTELFNGGGLSHLTPGTKAYVRKGIAGLRAFMRKHKAHLQAQSLRGV